MKVSIVTPSYNQGEFIEDTLRSVQAQEHPDLEHIVVDGGSTDGTLDILRAWEGTYDMRWTSEPDEGHWDAVNKGFDRASGGIVGWLNSDDVYLHQSTIARVVRTFEEQPDADVVYGDALTIDADNRVLEAKRVRDFSYDQLLRGCFLVQPAVFFRRHVVEAEQLRPDLEYALDYEYWLRLAQRFEFRHIPAFLAADRIHGDRKSTTGSDIQTRQSEAIRREYGYEGDRPWGEIPVTDRLLSGLPRRLAATRALIGLRNRDDEAVDLRWGELPSLLHSQLIRPLGTL